jgi:hypothetical protein
VTACISRNGDNRVVDAEAGKTCPDTQTTVRLASTDATGKVADADLLDGFDSSGFLGATAKAADADNLDGRDSADFVRIIQSTTRVVDYPPIAAHSCISDQVQVSIAAEGARVELGTPITRFTNLIAVGSQVAFSPGPDFRAHTDPHLARIVAAFGASIEDLDSFRRERPGRYEVEWSGDPNGGT